MARPPPVAQSGEIRTFMANYLERRQKGKRVGKKLQSQVDMVLQALFNGMGREQLMYPGARLLSTKGASHEMMAMEVWAMKLHGPTLARGKIHEAVALKYGRSQRDVDRAVKEWRQIYPIKPSIADFDN
jgi:hypothetical protein